MDIVAFAEDHISDAAGLLAARHAADRARDPRLPRRYEDHRECRVLIEELVGKGSGVAAIQGGKLAGYILTRDGGLADPQRRGSIPLHGHALASPWDAETYREMYAGLAPRLLRKGIFEHQVQVMAGDAAVSAAWFSLTFGQWSHVAARGLEAVDAPHADAVIRLAGPADAAEVKHLLFGLSRFDTLAPLFIPYVFSEEGWASEIEQGLGSEDMAFWLAYVDDLAVGGMQVGARKYPAMDRDQGCVHVFEAFVEPEARRAGTGTALLSHCLAWARDRGFEQLSLDFRTHNPVGGPFWRGHGFQPLSTVLHRRIDPRVAWADGTNQ